MEYKLNEFSEMLQKKKKNDEYHKKVLASKETIAMLTDHTSYIHFNLCVSENYSMSFGIGNPNRPLIQLDEADLEYFKNKYLPKIEDEYQKNLDELNRKYNK